MEPIVVAKDLVKRYKELNAVRGVSFAVSRGECFGFLGPNGAGKTSIMKMIGCVSPVTEGELSVDGMAVGVSGRTIKARIGVVPQEDTLDDELSVLNNLIVYGRYFGIDSTTLRQRSMESLDMMQLAERAHSKVDELSGGMKRRLTIARGLINQPSLLLLDEPTTGLDPQARHFVWRRLRYVKEQGVTLLLTTHYMEEASILCDRIVIMHEGTIVAEGRPADLVRHHAGEVVIEFRTFDDALRKAAVDALQSRHADVEEAGDTVYGFHLADEDAATVQVDGLRPVVRPANLEDVFLKLAGRALTE